MDLDRIAQRAGPLSRRFFKFCTVGASGVGVNLAFVWIGHQLFASLERAPQLALASALGVVVSVFTNFLLNDAWTWADRPKGHRIRDFFVRAGRYYLASGVAIGIQYGCAQLLAQAFGVWIYVAQAIGIVIGMGFNFAANHLWTFRAPPAPTDPPDERDDTLDASPPDDEGGRPATPQRES